MTAVSDGYLNGGELTARYVNGKISALQAGYLRGSTSQASRNLAQLRRAAGKEPGMTPEAWSLEFESLPDALRGKGSEPSWGEWAVHVALTLYALHQQSQTQAMHVTGEEYDFGCAVRRLVTERQKFSDLEQGQMPHRFAAMVTAQSMGELAHYARQIVGQLRAASIPVDYSRLARELYWFQYDGTKTRACLAWARSYSRQSQVSNTLD